MRLVLGFILIIICGDTLADEDAFVTTRVLTASTANQLAVAAEQTCRKKGYQVSVAVVDRYGNLLAFVRDPLSGAHTIRLAQDKAYTAASFQGATIELAERLKFLKGTPRVSLVGGGVPIRVAGYMYGAVGISGAPREKTPGDVDDACARAGIESVKDALEFAG
ncbi:GlcG/HbpS family heme-binding protein [Kaarinaea lacus]